MPNYFSALATLMPSLAIRAMADRVSSSLRSFSSARAWRSVSPASRIAVIYYMSNPFPLVKQCDFFALSSLYEGFGLVLAEADILGLPCFTADIMGPRGFMQKYGGLLVEDNENGLLAGMQSCMKGTIAPCLTIDYEQYNSEAVAQFESVI